MAQIWRIVDDLSCCEASKDRFKNVDNTGFFRQGPFSNFFKSYSHSRAIFHFVSLSRSPFCKLWHPARKRGLLFSFLITVLVAYWCRSHQTMQAELPEFNELSFGSCGIPLSLFLPRLVQHVLCVFLGVVIHCERDYPIFSPLFSCQLGLLQSFIQRPTLLLTHFHPNESNVIEWS